MRENILLVDDAADHARILKAILEHSNLFSITHVASGLEAYTLLKDQNHFSALITGLHLPGMNGFELLKRLKDEKRGLPTLILSQKQGQEDFLKGLSLGAKHFVTKPFSPSEVLVKVKDLLPGEYGK